MLLRNLHSVGSALVQTTYVVYGLCSCTTFILLALLLRNLHSVGCACIHTCVWAVLLCNLHIVVLSSVCVHTSLIRFSPPCSSMKDVSRAANVVHILALNILSDVIGWIYFAAWTISFYPQVRDECGCCFSLTYRCHF